jgi:hypothetical protein
MKHLKVYEKYEEKYDIGDININTYFHIVNIFYQNNSFIIASDDYNLAIIDINDSKDPSTFDWVLFKSLDEIDNTDIEKMKDYIDAISVIIKYKDKTQTEIENTQEYNDSLKYIKSTKFNL